MFALIALLFTDTLFFNVSKNKRERKTRQDREGGGGGVGGRKGSKEENSRSQFWRLNFQDQVAPSVQPLVRALLAVKQHGREHKANSHVQKRPCMHGRHPP